MVERINMVTPSWDLKGFIDDNVSIRGTEADGYPVVGGGDCLSHPLQEYWVVCAVGFTKTIKK